MEENFEKRDNCLDVMSFGRRRGVDGTYVGSAIRMLHPENNCHRKWRESGGR
jgi:hypothetical protein